LSAFLPYQQTWYADGAKVRICEKSRRIGITWAEAARQVLLAARSRSSGGRDCYYLSTSAKLGKEYIQTCSDWAKHLGLASSSLGVQMVEKNGFQSEEIKFTSGFRIQALTSNPESLRGKGGDVVVDEAAHHQDLAKSS
jgi:phage FluMu gp28-like protein